MGALVANKSLESGFFSLLTYNSTRGCTKEGGKKGGKKTPKIKNLQPKSTPPRPLADPTSQKCRQFFFFPKLEFWKQLITYMYEMIRIWRGNNPQKMYINKTFDIFNLSERKICWRWLIYMFFLLFLGVIMITVGVAEKHTQGEKKIFVWVQTLGVWVHNYTPIVFFFSFLFCKG